jgi:voltage-gated potassium channel Kch
MQRRLSLRDRLRYAFDNSLARGPIALIGWLALISLMAIVLAAALIHFARITQDGGETLSFFEAFWESLVRTLDSGTFGGDTGWSFRLVMLAVTLAGVFFVSALIGIVNNGLDSRMAQLRKGHSIVLENNHTLILGWSPKIFTIVSELVIANANQQKPRVVILAEKDVVEMKDEIAAHVGDTGKTRVIYRTGSPLELSHLEIVNPHTARSIIILAPESADPDSEVIKTILALTNHPRRQAERYHIVAELVDIRNLAVAQLAGTDEVKFVIGSDVIARLVVQTARQSGLSMVYTELLDFSGDEIYFQVEPQLVGRKFGEALFAYEDSTVIGLRYHAGGVQLNPPMDTIVQPGDQLVAISEDDDTVRVSGKVTAWPELEQQLNIDLTAIGAPHPIEAVPERTLLLGWNSQGPLIVDELDRYVSDGSSLVVVADVPELPVILERECGAAHSQTVTCRVADTTDRRVLDGLELSTYQQVIILCYSDTLDQQQADARTLITLLHLRDIKEKHGYRFRIVSELLDVRNRQLAEVAHADDFIVSNRLISLMLTQISENPELKAVFTDLFAPEGSEIYLKPAREYVASERTINFYTIVEAARRRGEVAIGYRRASLASDASRAYGIVVNPDKSVPVTFEANDFIVVLAER